MVESAPESALSPTTDAALSDRGLIETLDAERRRLGIPGAVVHVSGPSRGICTRALGVRDLATGEPLAADTRMRVGSVTKMIVALIILRLVDAGELCLDDEIHEHLPELSDLQVPRGVTVRRLLNMTSGLPDYTSEEFVEGLLVAPDRLWTPSELLEVAFSGSQEFAPGTSWAYCNAGYIVLGMLIEHLSNARVEDVARRLVFDPLGMHATELPPLTHGSSTLPDPRLRGYHRQADELADATRINPSWAWTAGNAVSTAGDLRLLVEASARGDLLQEQTHRERMSTHPVPETTLGYGLGIANFDGMWGHNGELPGFQSFAGYDPATGTTIVVLTNLDDHSADTLAAFLRARLADTAGS
ncbi:serine hydrolase domain-containing protein [Streptomyces sp. NPDC095613]|uniref:serine hydrolase domain-containing protein n=1 Tax=Streptomyces sp. NPDC095613 TaxID=3155540 RepID=UPI00331C7826